MLASNILKIGLVSTSLAFVPAATIADGKDQALTATYVVSSGRVFNREVGATSQDQAAARAAIWALTQ